MKRSTVLYDHIGTGYAGYRREDPEIRSALHGALGGARSVVNVGAGAGSYEPGGASTVAVEPSRTMIDQRGDAAGPAVRAMAHALPFASNHFEAAMSVLSIHHWGQRQEAGVREMSRVASQRVALITIDPEVGGRMWLLAEYLHEVAELDRTIFPMPDQIARWIGNDARVETLPVPRDTPDWMLLSFWAHPERVLDEGARAATSAFARCSRSVVDRVVSDVRRDLESGAWDRRHGHLRSLDAYDAGLRLVVGTPGGADFGLD